MSSDTAPDSASASASASIILCNPIKLHWYIFSYGHINTPINWDTATYDCIDNRNLVIQILHYWANVPDSTIQLEQYHISPEEISSIFSISIQPKITFFKDDKYILAPIFISQSNEWHIAIVFLIDSTIQSEKLFSKLKKIYGDSVVKNLSLISIASRKTIKFTKLETPPQYVWQIGPIKMRVRHILLGIAPYLPVITIVHRSAMSEKPTQMIKIPLGQ